MSPERRPPVKQPKVEKEEPHDEEEKEGGGGGGRGGAKPEDKEEEEEEEVEVETGPAPWATTKGHLANSERPQKVPGRSWVTADGKKVWTHADSGRTFATFGFVMCHFFFGGRQGRVTTWTGVGATRWG